MKNMPPDDNLLAGNEDFLASVYNLYIKDMYAYGLSCYPDINLIEDAIHDVFAEICLHWKNLPNIKNIKFYLISSLQHRIFFLLKKDRKYEEYLKKEYEEQDEGDEQQLWMEQEQKVSKEQLIGQLLLHLTPRQKEIIHLRIIDDFSFDEISQLMRINRQSAQNLFQRTIDKLRKEFGGRSEYKMIL